MRIRLATSADIPGILKLERQCPTAAHWSERQYQTALPADTEKPERLVLVAEAPLSSKRKRKSPPLAFLVARNLGPEWELENVVVAPSARRKRLGFNLLDRLLEEAGQAGGESVFLEVRESNTAARSLYQKSGFEETGRRTSYYQHPRENAVLYRRNLP